MNQDLLQRIGIEKPHDTHERFFWLIDRINLHRSCRWSPQHYEREVRELSDLTESLFRDWLHAQGITEGFECYDYIILPYLSFRFFNAPGAKEVDVTVASSSQKKKLLDHLVAEAPELPAPEFYRAVLGEALSKLLVFLRALTLQRAH